MSAPPERRLFARPPTRLVRVRPGGFEFQDTGEVVPEILGHVTAHRGQRKLFLEGILACQSSDAVVAANGTVCETCRHPLCRPQIRLYLADRNALYVVDLAVSSAKNFLDLEDSVQGEGLRLRDLRLRLCVEDRGHYGEVQFERAP